MVSKIGLGKNFSVELFLLDSQKDTELDSFGYWPDEGFISSA